METPRLDDSRLKGFRVRVTHPTLPLERSYCSICGKPKGWVTTESSEFIRATEVVVVCDGCVLAYGEPPLLRCPIEEVG